MQRQPLNEASSILLPSQQRQHPEQTHNAIVMSTVACVVVSALCSFMTPVVVVRLAHLAAESRHGRLHVLLRFLVFNDSCQTNYLKIY